MSEKKLEDILSQLSMHAPFPSDLTREEREQALCDIDNAKVGNLNEMDGYNCEICKNKGEIWFMQENEYDGKKYLSIKPCECSKARETIRRANQSGLGNILSDYTFAKFETASNLQKVIKEKAVKFCKDDTAHWFFIGGQTGAGKTHICTAIAAHYIKTGLNCKYMLWVEDSKQLKAVVNDYEAYQRMISEFKNVDVLYIDDFLKTKNGIEPTVGDVNLAFELLNNRLIDKSKITIISSEFTIPEALKIDEATIGRIYEMTGDYKINIAKDIKKNYRLRGVTV